MGLMLRVALLPFYPYDVIIFNSERTGETCEASGPEGS